MMSIINHQQTKMESRISRAAAEPLLNKIKVLLRQLLIAVALGLLLVVEDTVYHCSLLPCTVGGVISMVTLSLRGRAGFRVSGR